MISSDPKTWFDSAPAPQRDVLYAVRGVILQEAGPEVVEEVRWSRPHYRGPNGTFCYVFHTTQHVAVGFHDGGKLEDPKHLLAGYGAGLRHVKIDVSKAIDRAALRDLVRQAVTRPRPARGDQSSPRSAPSP